MRDATQLIQNADGSVYHLALKPGELARRIILVGDPGRVSRISDHFDRVELRRQKREFLTHTGYIGDTRLSVMATGISTDNIDIVLNELDALFNYDFDDQSPVLSPKKVKLLRLGTCGALQNDINPGTLVGTQHALGADGLMSWYEVPEEPNEALTALADAWREFCDRETFPPFPYYWSQADATFETLRAEQFGHVRNGLTYTAGGFYGPQGRKLRLRNHTEDFLEKLSRFTYGPHHFANIEMETAALLGLANALGHQAASVCVVLANRRTGKFHPKPHNAIDTLIETGLEMMVKW